MPTITYHGSRAELLRDLKRFVGTCAGRLPDSSGVSARLLETMGMELLGKVQEAYVRKSEGGTDALGIKWQPLSAVTLALRQKKAGGKVAAKLQTELKKLPAPRQRLIAVHYRRLLRLYRAAERGRSIGTQERRHAKHLLNLMRPFISKTRYESTLATLTKPLKEKKAQQTALIGAFALILRDTGRLLNSLSPTITSADRVLRVSPGAVSVGSNVMTKSGHNLLSLHNSDKPRKLKKDGKPKLPRRQILPDKAKPIPAAWWKDIADAALELMRQPEFWMDFLGKRATLGA